MTFEADPTGYGDLHIFRPSPWQRDFEKRRISMRKLVINIPWLAERAFPSVPNYTGFLLLNEAMFRTDRNRLTNLDTNVSVYLGVCELLSSSSEDIGHPQILSLVFAVLSQAFPCHHDRHRRLGNKVVTERAKQHTATVSQSMRSHSRSR